VGVFKPAPQPYRMAAERLGVPIERVRVVAAHDWDVAGAIRAGASAAFVARPELPFSPILLGRTSSVATSKKSRI